MKRVVADHLLRSFTARKGFSVAGSRWLLPWFCYSLSPFLSRVAPGRTLAFKSFSVRLGEGDLYTFGNLFEDYSVDLLRKALPHVSHVIDAGANVGAFSWLALQVADKLGHEIHVTAIEPSDDNVRFLRSQPFAGRIEILHGALGGESGFAKLKPGINSVTHTIEPAEEGLTVHSLRSLCREPTLLKMDIEGSEFEVLRKGLPDSIRALFLEWHPGPEADRPDEPGALVKRGRWRHLSSGIYGDSMWFWEPT